MGKIICPECGKEYGHTGKGADIKDTPCYTCSHKVKVDPKVDALCIEHRKKLGMYEAKYNTNSIGSRKDSWWGCSELLVCHETCPVPDERDKIYPPKKPLERLVKAPDGTDLPIVAPTNVAKGMEDLVNELTAEPKPKPKKRSLEDFLWLQSRVFDKLNRHPDLYEILDKLWYDEIVERLTGKTKKGVSEVMPAHLGGKMEFKPSKTTQKMFSDLEKQFAEEDEKTGKKAPPDFEGIEGRQMGGRVIDGMLGFELEEPKKKERIKCEQCGKDFTPVARPWGDKICDKCYDKRAKARREEKEKNAK